MSNFTTRASEKQVDNHFGRLAKSVSQHAVFLDTQRN
jgi:hypothetical protein